MKRKKFKHYRLEFWTRAYGNQAVMAVRSQVLSARLIEGPRSEWRVDQPAFGSVIVEVKVPIAVTVNDMLAKNFGMDLAQVIELDPLETLARALK